MNFPRFLLPSLPLWKLVEASKRLEAASHEDNGEDSVDLDQATPRFSFDSDGASIGIGGDGASGTEEDALSQSGESEYYTTDDDYNDFEEEDYGDDGDEGNDDNEEEEEEEEEEEDDGEEEGYYDDSGSEAAGSASGSSSATSASVPIVPDAARGVSLGSGSSAPSSYDPGDDVNIGGTRRSSTGSSSRRRGKRAAAAAAAVFNNGAADHGVGEVEELRFGIRRSNTDRSHHSKRTSAGGCLAATASTLKCHRCQTDLCFSSAIISKGFTGRHGRAYLVSSLLPSNILHSKPTSRTLQTGPHTVADISCTICGSNLGWKYIAAEDRSQRYKVGKYILETGKVIRCNHWERHGGMDDEKDWQGWELGWEEGIGAGLFGCGNDGAERKKTIEVDSEDEDELEEFFSGTWDPDKVARRREKRRNKAIATGAVI